MIVKIRLMNAGSMYVAFLEVKDCNLTNYEGQKGKVIGNEYEIY
jgi:hypothetical protein